MATPRKVTIKTDQGKGLAVRAVGTSVANTVTIDFDSAASQLDIISAIDKIREVIIEEEY